MGCGQSVDVTGRPMMADPRSRRNTTEKRKSSSLASPSSGTKSLRSAKYNGISATTPSITETRPRTDTWGDNHIIVPAAPRTDPTGEHIRAASMAAAAALDVEKQQQHAVVSQWKLLWSTQSKYLVDPADVETVLEQLVSKTADKFSPVQMTFLQRKVRYVVGSLPTESTSNSKAIIGRVFSSSSSNANNASSHHNSIPWNEKVEARQLVEKYHLLTSTLLRMILPDSPVIDTITQIMLALSPQQNECYERVRVAATAAAKSVGLEMDVNKLSNSSSSNNNNSEQQQQKSAVAHTQYAMPKPSRIPIPIEPVRNFPIGATLNAVACVLALGLEGTRPQKIQLLFYVLMESATLLDFMATHPAGGVPTWLLEVGNDTVISLPSLTHYHYYGNAFLPHGEIQIRKSASSKKKAAASSFVPSQSRNPIKINAQRAQQIILNTLSVPDDDTDNGSSHHHQQQQRKIVKVAGDGNSLISSPGSNIKPSSSNTKDGTSSLLSPRRPSDINSANSVDSMFRESWFKNSTLMKHLFYVSEGIMRDPFCNRVDLLSSSVQKLNQYFDAETQFWDLQEFSQWSSVALDDWALQKITHRLLGQGIMPSPAVEHKLVLDKWLDWQSLWNCDPTSAYQSQKDGQTTLTELVHTAWGGLGGIDGKGALGYGVLYCVPKLWWDQWASFVHWNFVGDPHSHGNEPHRRPASLLTEFLLEVKSIDDNDADAPANPTIVRGTLGSYEVMKQDLKRDEDYVLLPPGVWDLLYELYGGGPALPRMVNVPESNIVSVTKDHGTVRDSFGAFLDEELNTIEISMDRIANMRAVRVPEVLSVVTHPWILHVLLCDPVQPYRRGESGPMSIRVMAHPNQPLWRVFAEIVCRFPLQSYRAYDSDKLGMARLWKKSTPTRTAAAGTNSIQQPRYGPWNLLCKNRHATLHLMSKGCHLEDNYDEVVADWKQYTDNNSVESIGLLDNDTVLLEFAVQNKNGDLTWPREAAAKAGQVQRLAQEDLIFRQTLQGVDSDDNPLPNPPTLVGMEVDAQDSSGKWYTVKIIEVRTKKEGDDTDDNDSLSQEDGKQQLTSKKQVKVHFRVHGGYFEWIDVDSDQLQTAGRCASEMQDQDSFSPAIGNGSSPVGEGRSKSSASAKRANSNTAENPADNTKSCPLPGLGACGLTNLGNTCYMNSALQCLGYLPLLRAYILSSQYKLTGDLNKDNPLGTGGKLLEELADLQRAVWSARFAEKSPSRFRTQLAKTNSQFSGADQQDAQEFLNYIIDVLHEDSNKVRQKPYVEALEDEWVEKTYLPRVGEEAWRRFLRRNRSIMADVTMGQALNTVTCPVCNHKSRSFDPFNLLSIPIPTGSDIIFQCTVIRRGSALNCPWILNQTRQESRKGNDRLNCLVDLSSHYQRNPSTPSPTNIAEQYVISLSRLADVGDLRLQIQNLSGIRANRLRLCRAEEIVTEIETDNGSELQRQTKVIPLTDKEGPASHYIKKHGPSEDTPSFPTQIIAFELTLNPRDIMIDTPVENQSYDRRNVTNKEDSYSPGQVTEIERYLSVYGDEKECRLVDTDVAVLSEAVSRSMWPRSDSDFKIGLRVDAKDHRGNWFVGSVVDVYEEEITKKDADTGEPIREKQKKVRVHFDNFLPKWDEKYSFDHFQKDRVAPLYTKAEANYKPTELMVHHRLYDQTRKKMFIFGQSFYIQCHSEWSNARAGAHILAQVSRFLPRSASNDFSENMSEVYNLISDLIDLFIDYDRKFVQMALGVSQNGKEIRSGHNYCNPNFVPDPLFSELDETVHGLLRQLPFELRVCTVDTNSDKINGFSDDVAFPFVLNRTIGNFVSARSTVVVHWRDVPKFKSSNEKVAILYVQPEVHIHEASKEILKLADSNPENSKKSAVGSNEVDLSFCLNEFCKVQKLPISDNWQCPRCMVIREGGQKMNLWRLPDLLTFHVKRFNMSARWHEKITTRVNFPLTGLDMSQWCHNDSPVLKGDPAESHIYDLIAVMNHYGGLTGGHYVATCKATLCGKDGHEEVAYSFNGAGMEISEIDDCPDEPSGWFQVRSKSDVNRVKVAAAIYSKTVACSAEPLWLQFDDDVVEAIPPKQVISEMAYVLFYRRRCMTASNIAKYSTLE